MVRTCMKLDFPGQHSNSVLIVDWGLRNEDLEARSQESVDYWQAAEKLNISNKSIRFVIPEGAK